ncbi:DUF625-domain-containing protein [Hyphopichia burtonii NRRL Y-1933]|uniref:DUF625-domain-containing protein n=1 Tax=Hyphopichia burtonii NRRL Y-1933 TaxID=984485 RepID=A0A1E4RDN4_9ASCO|nr:DUF625-domain-containing protein [Hyphopichia burtonii NRRL Y-1933]ODV65378.1 DUF625-domain-containing protein [Hyphopichia burtonii NRRL Y-1933]
MGYEISISSPEQNGNEEEGAHHISVSNSNGETNENSDALSKGSGDADEPHSPPSNLSSIPLPTAGPSSSPHKNVVDEDDEKKQSEDEREQDPLYQEMLMISTKVPRRVKVYLLQGEDWLDNGTGYCTGEFSEDTHKPYFFVRSELHPQEVILKSYLEGSIQYQRQQETLIVWTDLSGKDLALSFQETEGCADLCEFIIKVQQQGFSSDISLYYVISNASISDNDGNNGGVNEITELITGPINIPEDPTIDNLESIIDVISQGSNSQYTRSCILKFIIESKFFEKLIDVFNQSEEKRKLQNLFTLTEIIKILIIYNEPSIIEDFVSSESKILGLVGILEYDPEYPNFKATHREIFADKSKFKTVIEIPNDEDKINIFKRDFYLNFLKNVVLARYLDDQTFNTLNSLIFFNQVEIINFLKNSESNDNFCTKLFNIYDNDNDNNDNNINNVNKNGICSDNTNNTTNNTYNNNNNDDYNHNNKLAEHKSTNNHINTSPSSSIHTNTDSSNDTPNTPISPNPNSQNSKQVSLKTKRNGVKMLHQYVLITKSLQSYQKSEFFSVLVKTGLFKMLSFALKDTDSNTRVLGTELIVIIIEQDVSLVNSIDNDNSIDILDPPSMSPAAAAAAAANSENCNDNNLIDKDKNFEEHKPLKFKLSDDMTLSLILSKLLLEDKNPGLKIQAFEALRILLDSNIASNTSIPGQFEGSNGEPNMKNVQNGFDLEVLRNQFSNFQDEYEDEEGEENRNPLNRGSNEVNDINTNNYFEAFYSKVAPGLFKELSDLSYSKEDSKLHESIVSKIKGDEILYQHLCDLISFCSKEHEAYISRPFFLENNILLGVSKLMVIDVKITLKLSAIRCLKNILLLNDGFYSRYIINNDIFQYFFDFFNTIISENNLANSTCLDLLEIIIKNCDKTVNHGKRHNFKLLAEYIYKNFKDICRDKINYVSTGKELVKMVENEFYEDDTKQFGVADTSFDSEDDEFLNNGHNVSTPIKSDEEVEPNELNEHLPLTNGSGPHNLFEDIEKDMGHKTHAKRAREDDNDSELQPIHKKETFISVADLPKSVLPTSVLPKSNPVSPTNDEPA